MWTRVDIKEKGKASFKRNYWKTVLVALLVISLEGGSFAGSSASSRVSEGPDQATEMSEELTREELEELSHELESEGFPGVSEDDLDHMPELEDMPTDVTMAEDVNAEDKATFVLAATLVGLFVGALVLVALAIGMTFAAFVVNPLKAGAARYFTLNLNRKAEVKEIAHAFDHNYRETVKTLFWRDVYTILWGLLLIVPGIVKAYEYRMIPYLLAEDDTLTKDRAFAESKRLMQGNKWRAFVLDLSFLGWYLLSILTLGVLAVFYVSPYKCMVDAALYESLRYGTSPAAPQLDAPRPEASSATSVPVPPFAAEGAPAPVWEDEPTREGAEGSGAIVPQEPEA